MVGGAGGNESSVLCIVSSCQALGRLNVRCVKKAGVIRLIDTNKTSRGGRSGLAISLGRLSNLLEKKNEA